MVGTFQAELTLLPAQAVSSLHAGSSVNPKLQALMLPEDHCRYAETIPVHGLNCGSLLVAYKTSGCSLRKTRS